MPFGNFGGNSYRNSTGGNNRAPGGGSQQRPQRETTDGQSLYNDAAGKILDFSYWGDYVNLAIITAPPGTPLDWNTKRNAQARTTCAMSFTSLSEFWDICDEVMDSLKNTGSFSSDGYGIRIGSKQDVIIELNDGKKIGQPTGIYLVIYKGVDSSGRAGSMDYYPFPATRVIRGYDHATGRMKDDVSKVGQFKEFWRLVKAATKAFSKAEAHTCRVVWRNDRLKEHAALNALAAKLGVDINAEYAKLSASGGGNRGSYGGNRGGGNRSFGASRNYGGSNYQLPPDVTPMADLNAPIDLNIPLENLSSVNMKAFS